eukprot:gene8275-11203_t
MKKNQNNKINLSRTNTSPSLNTRSDHNALPPISHNKSSKHNSHLASALNSSLPLNQSSSFPISKRVQLTKPWCLEYKFDENLIVLPKKILFDDFLYIFPKKEIDLRGWTLCSAVFETIKEFCSNVLILHLENCRGITSESFENLRGLKLLRKLSLSNTGVITESMAVVFGTIKLLMTLHLSGCETNAMVYSSIALTCSNLKILICSKVSGLNDVGLTSLGQCIQRFRKLERIDLSYVDGITDDGVLSLFSAGFNILSNVSLAHCKCLSSLCLASIRSKMAALKILNISNMSLGQSAFEWIGEGCNNIVTLDLSHSIELDNSALITIGRRCPRIENLNIRKCVKLDDEGVAGFFERLFGYIKTVDLSGCINCTGTSIEALSKKANELIEIKLNGLSKISAEALLMLFTNAKKLKVYEMCSELRATVTHRRSMIPHIGDMVLINAMYDKIEEIKLSGACQVSDRGVASLITKCGSTLRSLDISYCHQITDISLGLLATGTSYLSCLIISGCMGITNRGIVDISTHCNKYLTQLELNGCAKVSDSGLSSLSLLTNLKILGIRNCDQATDDAIVIFSKSCTKLETIDITSLDLVGPVGIESIVKYCHHLKVLNCELCNITPKELMSITKNKPFYRSVTNKCKIQALPDIVINYNLYVDEIKLKNEMIIRIQKFSKMVKETIWKRAVVRMKIKRRNDMNRNFQAWKNVVRKSRKHRQQIIYMKNVRRLQRCMKRLYAIYISKKHLKYLKVTQVAKKRERELAIQREIERNKLWNKSAKIISKNLKAGFFNKLMSKFILICCICYRTDYDQKKWNSTNIQKRWRGYIVRLKNYRYQRYCDLLESSALKVQKVIRGRRIRKRIAPYMYHLRLCYYNWKRYIVISRPRLRLGIYAKKIQKCFRLFNFKCHRYTAAIKIQSVFRSHRTRLFIKFQFYLAKIDSIEKIKRVYHIYRCRKQRKLMIARRHMAVYKIEALVFPFFLIQRQQKEYALKAKSVRVATNQMKKEALIVKREL